MLPTTYRGDATIDGEMMPAELRLDSDNVRLAVGQDQEIIRWPIMNLEIEPSSDGGYSLRSGEQSFRFAPAVDDGLGDEISLRRRFANVEGVAAEPEPETLADRVKAAPRPKKSKADKPKRALRSAPGPVRRNPILEGRDIHLRTALIVLGALAAVVLVVAVTSGAFEGRQASVVVGAEDLTPTTTPPNTAAQVPATTVPVTTAPAPTVAPPATATPPTVAAATVTTQPPTITTVAPATTTTTIFVPEDAQAFELTLEEMIAGWNEMARRVSSQFVAQDLTAADGQWSFEVGDYVTIEGTTDGAGLVDRVRFSGDPSGSVDDDRDVLSALGMTVELVAPQLPPEGRRQLLLSLGLDVDDPVLAGLDGRLDYEGNTYTLRWDADLARIVFVVAPAAPDDTEE